LHIVFTCSMIEKKPLTGLTSKELSALATVLGAPGEYGYVIAKWIYRKRAKSLSEINDLPKRILKELEQEGYEISNAIGIDSFPGTDGSTRYLLTNPNGQYYESVFMDNGKRKTLCVSSQSGCRMGCRFCMTGSIGFMGNLDTSSIVDQVLVVPESKSINRLVIMGMGEPFDNYDAIEKALEIFTANWGLALGKANITLSTVGIANKLEPFLSKQPCNLAISLHSPFPEERAMLMPVENSSPIERVIDILKRYPLKKPVRLSFEYVALSGINTSEEHAKAIAALLKGLKYHLNIIPWNEHPAAQFNKPEKEELYRFTSWLNQNGVLWTIRHSKGNETGAACGQMAGKWQSTS